MSPWTFRRRWYAASGRQRRLARPVISIGNLSVGGRGKTPVAGLVARLLLDAGERPAILTRGYGRRRAEHGAVVVSDGTHLLADVDRSGDEPLMLARAVPGAIVIVCDRRAIAGALAERAFDATVHVLDDGFQHVTLARDVDVVIVSAADLSDRPLPFGRLREPFSSLIHADAVIADDDEAAVRARVDALGEPRGPAGGERPVFALRRALGAPVALEGDAEWTTPSGRAIGLAGIAQPDRFFRALAGAGWEVVHTEAFRDHHRYTRRDVSRLAEVAARLQAPVLTTAKDAIRLLPLRPLPMPVAVLPLEVAVEPADGFRTWLVGRLREARR